MTRLIKSDSEYSQWIKNISHRYRKSQIKAAVRVNDEMLRFYWSLGKDIVENKAESKWGSGFYENLSKDLKRELPDATGLSETNLRYMKRFYQLYESAIQAQLVPETEAPQNQAQPASDFRMEELSSIPWGHHRRIIVKSDGDVNKAIFYVRKTIENNWSRAVLENFMDSNLYERQGNAISNFECTLPEYQSNLAQQITKDPYNFDFLTLREKYNER